MSKDPVVELMKKLVVGITVSEKIKDGVFKLPDEERLEWFDGMFKNRFLVFSSKGNKIIAEFIDNLWEDNQ